MEQITIKIVPGYESQSGTARIVKPSVSAANAEMTGVSIATETNASLLDIRIRRIDFIKN